MKKSLLKKIMCGALAAAMIMSICTGCGSEKKDDSKSEGNTEKTYKVGICQLTQHEALDAATKGFQDALKEKLGDKVEFVLQNASGDSATCATIANQFVHDGVDLILANATPALQAAMAATGDIPIVATSITDFATALEADEWTGKTGINVTGTSDLAPRDKQAAMIKELLPEAKTVGILYCSSEANSKYQADVVKAELDKLGLTSKVYTVADTNEIATVVTKACEEVDCLYIPTDNTIAEATAAVKEVAEPKNIPIVAGEEGICRGCGIATLSISYYDLGTATGKMAAKILKGESKIEEMPIEYAPEFTKKYNKSICDELGITIPEGYEAIE